ncbi:pirin family protein [Luteimonas yindakuii]|uniref:Pirin family protein n=1 Tax=Luteimonas yindakuii TaxID=2565782 RepID=A0A4Z1RCU4_9GAMM|nr:pirin family protein [Luteimonas yindakuii]TKS54628.1 pirin family protein [Luteimonas yindakuii]
MIELVIPSRRRDLGGFEVGRVLPFAKRRMIGPYIFFDRMGPTMFEPGLPRSADVRPHPHIGLSTITYLFEGEIMHRDSVGSEQPIRPGEVNWMTSGRGITHSERFEQGRAVGGPMDGIQAWVALPDAREEMDPGFWHYDAGELPTFDEGGVWGRLIAGELAGIRSPAAVDSPQFYVHWQLRAGTRVSLPPEYPERAVYVADGAVEIDGQRIEPGSMAVLAPGAAVTIAALGDAVVMALGGEPVGERFIDWNFVSSSKERILQARADWAAGRMKLPDLDDQEFIPLPPAIGAAPEPMS